jgi:hypothetical protein
MKTALFVIACLALTAAFIACTSAPAGQYSVEQVNQGIQDAVDAGMISPAQGSSVAGKIAVAHPGFDWGGIVEGVGAVVSSLALGYLGLRPAMGRMSNASILGEEHSAALDALVARKKAKDA